MIGNKNKMAFSKRKIGFNVIAAFIVFKFITAPITDATLTIEEIKAAICAVTDGNYDTTTLSNQNVWAYNKTKDASQCLTNDTGDVSTSCEFLFSFCHGYNCSDTDKSLMNTTACITTQGKTTNTTFKLGSYDPNLNPFENIKDGQGLKFLAHFTNGGKYNSSTGDSCVLSMDIEFDCNFDQVWQNSAQKKAPISQSALTSIKFDSAACKYTLKFDYSGACPPKIEPGEDSEGLSFGSWLLILFFVGLTVYFVFGSLLKYCVGNRGREILPHSEFWTMLPVYIADGFIFTCTCGRGSGEANSQYDSI